MIRCLVYLSLACALPIAACTQIPELDASVPPEAERADYPELVPVERLLGVDAFDPASNEATADQLDSRTRNLQARAQRLRERDANDG